MLQVQSTFSSRSWEEHHETWKEHRYEWLPSWQEIPKHLHEALATPHLSKLKVRVNKASQDGDQGNVPLVPSARKCPYGVQWDCLLSVGSSKAKREASLVATCNAGNANPSFGSTLVSNFHTGGTWHCAWESKSDNDSEMTITMQ